VLFPTRIVGGGVDKSGGIETVRAEESFAGTSTTGLTVAAGARWRFDIGSTCAAGPVR
jgi:hypothetical protein